MTQEQSILSKIVTLFATEKIMLQHNVLGYRIDAYFPKYKLAIEVDEKGIMTEILTTKYKDKKHYKKNLVVILLELIQLKNILIFLLKLVKWKITLLNQLKN